MVRDWTGPLAVTVPDDLAGLEALFGRCGTHDGVIV